ncbi:alpha/beta-hydrolase [Mollisia scopiformis]|uniref:Alpha/beta-hydrolase n=1 Tax=Mollisia scopiformis TaxID=149040 RepID=A0A194X7F9_MOLSC|nr:alpha/beta-hydrolase [Mollisia scopiformis]KUJ16110.1 alpha/beta-hydrolase [Mollisia scopiformis]
MARSNKIESPRTTLIPFISAEEADSMAYPPNALPGARDVESFYGAMRVYEWGSTNGEKVLFVHGDATPCPLFSKIAQGLVDAGYRVMLFDLWGRGYSDTPLDCRHDDRLFASQILLALTSSPLSWMGNGSSFSIVAFSLGGPISLAFTGAFPESVRSLILLGPAGLIRKLPDGYEDDYVLQPELAPSPEALREKVREILGAVSSSPALNIQTDKKRVVSSEQGPSRVEKSFNMGGLIQWQFDHHLGHVHSFQDTVRYGPLQKREDLWGKVCDIIAGRTRPDSALHNTKLLVIFGRDDDVVVGEETTEDILKLLPARHLQVEYVPGGHGFLYPNSEKITQTILSFQRSKLSKV